MPLRHHRKILFLCLIIAQIGFVLAATASMFGVVKLTFIGVILSFAANTNFGYYGTIVFILPVLFFVFQINMWEFGEFETIVKWTVIGFSSLTVLFEILLFRGFLRWFCELETRRE